ncbi:MAG: TatD family hydrolase [bacterium]
MTGLFDSHAHLDLDPLAGQVDQVLARAREVGVQWVTAVGVGRDSASLGRAAAIARRYAGVFATAGIHPHDASRAAPELLAELREVARAPEVAAVGEMGLDYHYMRSPREVQRGAFRAQLRIADELGKPVVIHLREAHRDAMEMLKSEPLRGGIVHCFSEGPAELAEYLALGLHISFSGIVTFPGAHGVREAAALVPSDRLLVETDAPYLAPVPHRGEKNEPAYVVHTARAVAGLRREELETIVTQTTANARAVYRLDD